MGKHDDIGHQLHIPKAVKFKQAKPATNTNQNINAAPQMPQQGQETQNQYR